jgi:alkylation response protein AidB-like acyl-CoA dehydrogenase
MSFFQSAPQLGNQFDQDALLREYLERVLPREVFRACTDELRSMGALAAGPLLELTSRARKEEPQLVEFDPWGHRIDEIRTPEAWRTLARIASEQGLVGIPYERQHGAYSRIHQFAMVYLFAPSSAVYTCPLAMSDGAVRTLQSHGNAALIDRAVPRLISRNPAQAWTSGQWMTERTGGSDVGLTQTEARQEGAEWRLFGNKWFTSATTAEMSLTLARPRGNPAGGKGLALFYLELRDADGALNGIRIHRLKDKLGTRMLPTAELELEGARATPVAGLSDGIKAIAPMLQITRTWNAICSVASMRRGCALATDYAARRVAFGAPLSEKPLHVQTLADLQARFEAAFLLAFRAVELLGREETGEASESERLMLRALQPIAKLLTAKEAVAAASEALEAFGGAGYIEDTGLPALLRDAQVLPIWEGTTNVLALDSLRVLANPQSLAALLADLESCASGGNHPSLVPAAKTAVDLAQRAASWFRATAVSNPGALEAGARAFAMALGHAYAMSLAVRHAQWCIERGAGTRNVAVAERLSKISFPLPDEFASLENARAVLSRQSKSR